ncbi:hypothetical protein TorRG33x02_255730 [Trema orientale]|uniref:DUF247 domain protein n=1 Tax=Trema orientale TaxID=63057 RepID=A0A2P5DC71_TREOI|nr:hypothetical protein TorRG33x02_255730 [Trema orientale]
MAYTPQLVSIGPFHYVKKELKALEYLKEKYQLEFYERIEPESTEKIEKMKKYIEQQSEDIRACYAGTIEVKGEKFNEMIMRDACFIFELFSKVFCGDQNDYILQTPWLKNTIMLDMILLENQLPFKYLNELYERAEIKFHTQPDQTFYSPSETEVCYRSNLVCGIKDNIINCFTSNSSEASEQLTEPLNPHPSSATSEHNEPGTSSESGVDHTFIDLTIGFFRHFSFGSFDKIKEIKHFTDLVRQSWLPERFEKLEKDQDQCPKENYLYGSAKELDKAGVDFAPAVASEKFLADVQIDEPHKCLNFIPCRKIELPLFTMDAKTESLMRNVIAFEQCNPRLNAVICNYVALMNELIDTEEDVDFLVKKNIIKNLLGNNREAADLVKKLNDEITEANFVYSEVCEKLNHFYKNWFNVTRATLSRVYFKDLWTGSSTIVGILVVIFTIVSTIKAIFFS